MAKERPYRICVYCDRWQNGGVEAYLMNLFRFWNRQKLEVQLAVSQKESELYDRELAALGIWPRVTLDRVYASPMLRILHNLGAMRRLLKTGGFDAVYLNLSNSFTMIYAWMARQAGIPVRAVHSHCGDIRPGATRPVKQIAHALGRRLFTPAATQLFACSELAGRWMFGNPAVNGGRVRLVHNAVDTRAFAKNAEGRREARAGLGVDNRWVAGTVGRFVEQKNPMFLLDCFGNLAKLRPDAVFLWIGEGDLQLAVQARARELGLADRVIFYGATDQVPRMLWAMDVFCLPSRFEGNPVSVIEAQAAGCMCLVSNTVTEQCKITDNLRFLPIDQGPEPWGKAMAEAQPVVGPEGATAQVRSNGYDAEQMSAEVQAMLYRACAAAGESSR